MPSLTLADAQERINNRYPNENLKVLEFTKYKGPSKIQCLDCGATYEFSRFGDSLAKRKRFICHNCGKDKHIRSKFEQSLKDRFPNEPFELVKFKNTQEYCELKCLKCGKISKYQSASSLQSKVHICNCYTEDRHIQEMIPTWNRFKQFIKDSDEWTLIDEDIMPTSLNSDLVACKCNKCGAINKKRVWDYLKGIHCQCNRQSEDVKNKVLQICEKEGYTLLSDCTTFRQRITLQHECDFIYSVNVGSFLNGYARCPQCCRKQTRGERAIINYLKEHNINYEREYVVNINDHLLRFDFYLPDYDYFIEYQGRQHYEVVDFFGGEDKFEQRQMYDQFKRDFAGDNLLEISYLDFNNIDGILETMVQRLGENRTLKQGETEGA